MATPRRRPQRMGTSALVDVLEAIRAHLAAERAAGVPFDAAWSAALELAPGTWCEPLEATRDAWADAYGARGGRARGAGALVRLREAALDDEPPVNPWGARLVA